MASLYRSILSISQKRLLKTSFDMLLINVQAHLCLDHYDRTNWMHAINGLMYGNLNGLEMCSGDRVSWHLITLGNEIDVHGITFTGQTFLLNNQRKDVVDLMPGESATLLYTTE